VDIASQKSWGSVTSTRTLNVETSVNEQEVTEAAEGIEQKVTKETKKKGACVWPRFLASGKC
jgi:hypothetical protein